MKLLTQELRRRLPPLYSQERSSDPLVVAKFFDPWSNWTWYVLEGSPVNADGYALGTGGDTQEADFLFFAFVVGFEEELGYVSRSELESITLLGKPRIERDLHWRPTPLSKVMSGEVR